MSKDCENLLKEMIIFHGFSSNVQTGFSCYIPDPKPFSKKEGILLFVCTPKGKRIVTKIEHLIKKTRINRLNEILTTNDDELKIWFYPIIVRYIDILFKLGFNKIGKGLNLDKQNKVYNQDLALTNFETNNNLLKDFELFLITNPITKFAEERGIFAVKNKNVPMF